MITCNMISGTSCYLKKSNFELLRLTHANLPSRSNVHKKQTRTLCLHLQKVSCPILTLIMIHSMTPPMQKKIGRNLYAPSRCFPGTILSKPFMVLLLWNISANKLVFLFLNTSTAAFSLERFKTKKQRKPPSLRPLLTLREQWWGALVLRVSWDRRSVLQATDTSGTNGDGV